MPDRSPTTLEFSAPIRRRSGDEVAPPARPRPRVAWIDRLVASPTVRSGYASAVVHLVILSALALLLIERPARERPRPLELSFATAGHAAGRGGDDDPPPPVELAAPEPAKAADPAREDPAREDPARNAAADQEFERVAAVESPPVATAAGADVMPAASEPANDIASTPALPAAAKVAAHARQGPGTAAQATAAYAARRGPARAAAVRGRGGSAASEAAVERGLAWLALHQADDGSWRFDLSGCRCDDGCSHAGTIGSTTAATGLALLPFLGAGHTQLDGVYQETVSRGLYYLVSRLRPTPRGGDLCEGTMYGHGAATLALAEAFGMTRDDLLARPLADAVRFIVTAQDAYGGGWRYLPGQSGDTTVTAWQLAALKSGHLCGLEVPTPTIDGVRRFLDRVQARGGEAYGYQGPRPRPCTSAIGLFCRLHTGWQDAAVIDRGLAALARTGPDPDAIYLNFYLSQALLQADHAAWPRWNVRHRDLLVARQGSVGHERGSWWLADAETAPGGRLAHTALAVLTLEVYYRLLPLYRPEAVGDGW
jgi:hypothetical protein